MSTRHTFNNLSYAVFSVLCFFWLGCSSPEPENPVTGRTFTLQYNPADAGILTDSDQIWVVYAFDYWGTRVLQRLRGEGEQDDLFQNVLNPDPGRSSVKEMVRKDNGWVAEIPIPRDASLISYYLTDGTRHDYNHRKTYVSYVYDEDGIPVRSARFRNIDFLIMAGEGLPVILDEILREIEDHPDHFISHVVYWRFRFFDTVSPDTLMTLLDESMYYFSDLHREYGDTVLNYKILSLNDFNRIMRLSLQDKFDDPKVTNLREIVNSTILQTIEKIPREGRVEQIPHIEFIAKMMLQTPAQRRERDLENMERIMEQLAERIERTRSELERVTKSPEDRSNFFLAVDEMPQIIGGVGSIQRNIRYPAAAREKGVGGTVYVLAYVDEEGNVARTEIVGDPGAGLGEAAAAAVARAKFIPGRQQGQPVPVRVSIPIHFRLSESPIARREPVIDIIEGPEDLIGYLTYPEDAMRNNIEGEVHTRVTLDENAHIVGIWVVSGSDERLARATMEGILKYPFADDETYHGISEQKTVPVNVRYSIK